MAINVTDEILVKTKKGKLASAKQVFLDGDTENLQQVGDKLHQVEQFVKDITISGGASTASAVSYDNSTSGLTAVTAQGGLDELASKDAELNESIKAKLDKADMDDMLAKKVDKSSISQELGDDEDKVPSQKLLNDSLSIKANSEDVSNELDKKIDKENIEIGDTLSEDDAKVPSSALVSKVVEEVKSSIPKFRQLTQAEYDALESVDATTYYMCTEE